MRFAMLHRVTQSETKGVPAGQRSANGVRSPMFLQAALPATDDAAAVLKQSLSKPAATIAPWFLYDELGSKLFDAITALPEYYPTRTEALVLAEHLPAMAAVAPVSGCTLIDLGAGNCEKAPQLFPVVKPRQYVAVDISADFLRTALQRLQHEHPEISMLGVGTDFSSQLELPPAVGRERRLFFYPGSSIGNFTRAQAVAFLTRVREAMTNGGVLWIGTDLRKDPAIMQRAYDDELGVTAAFNRNGLRNVNRITQANFSPADWRHVAVFNEAESRIEMHLEAKQEVLVKWPDGERRFAAGERIHTESSHKHTPETFGQLLGAAGLRQVGMWTDPRKWFGMFAAVPAAEL